MNAEVQPGRLDDTISFELDGQSVTALAGESLWDVARRQGTRRGFRICAMPISRDTRPMATAAPAWSRSRANGYSPHPASVLPGRA